LASLSALKLTQFPQFFTENYQNLGLVKIFFLLVECTIANEKLFPIFLSKSSPAVGDMRGGGGKGDESGIGDGKFEIERVLNC
jgi:hypothetical protein